MEQDVSSDLTVYYYCHKCRGLLPAQSHDAAASHVSRCVSGAYRSSCDLFAVDKRFCHLLEADSKETDVQPLETGVTEDECETSRCEDINRPQVIKTEENGVKENNTVLSNAEENIEDRVKKENTQGMKVTGKHRTRSSTRITNSQSHSDKLIKPSLAKATDWSERREALEKKYSKYLVSTDPTEGQKAKLKDAKFNSYYQCPHCEQRISYVGHFERHIRQRHNSSGLFRCPQCDFSCADNRVFQRHKFHHEKRFVCNECDRKFTFKKDLQRHVWKHSGLKPFKCELCDFTSRFKETLTSHMRKHTGDKLKCDYEGCAFTTIHPSALRIHKSVKHPAGDTKVYQCALCPYNTLNHGTFNEHVKRHVSDKNFYCSLCDYRGYSKAEVLKHMNIHTQETRYFCDKCSFKTAHRTSFINHMKAHNGIKPYQCSACGYSSVTKQKVLRHITNRRECTGANVYKYDFHIDLRQYRQTNPINSFLVEVASTSNAEYSNGEVNGISVTEDAVVNGMGDSSVLHIQEVDIQEVNDVPLSDTPAVDDTGSHCTVITDCVLQGDVVTCLL